MTCCRCCSGNVAKWSTLASAVVILVVGIILASLWNGWFTNIVNQQLSVSDRSTKGFDMWKETPIPMYLDFHIFNWTNAPLVAKDKGIKPLFVEMGPYVFYEHHIRENITFNDNDTLTYLNKRTYRFEPDMSSGNLSDMITFINPIVMVVTHIIRDDHYLVQRAVNFFLEEQGEELYVTKNVSQLLFEGYDDKLIHIARKLNMSEFKIPFQKFGWFVDRNNSATYDGVFNMYTGGKDISKLGLITEWNYQHQSPYYPGDCGVINGSSGELWWPPHNDEEISIFAPDLCSDVKLHKNGYATIHGIKGNYYTSQADVFDNGTTYNSTSCFASGMPTGVRSVEACKFGAPAYVSSPHFYMADPIYRKNVDGMNPDPSKHVTSLTLEPETGLPLKVYAAFQLNLLMIHLDGIDVLYNQKETMMPCFWFAQRAELTSDLATLAKFLIIGGNLGKYTGYGLISIASLLVVIFGVVTYRKRWGTNDEEYLVCNEKS